MRDTKFRGRTKAGEWLYGYLMQMHSPDRLFIGTWHNIGGEATVKDELFCSYLEVIPETVGEYTGLHDKNGKEIYEGDYLRHYGENPYPQGVVEFYEGNFKARWKGGKHLEILFPRLMRHFEVIGNIHENPELLGGVGER